MSGGEPSSIKQNPLCAAGMPSPSPTVQVPDMARSSTGGRGHAEHRSMQDARNVNGQFRLPVFPTLGGKCMYQALYRKWRPTKFADVVGQRHITDTLRAQLESGRLSHAYLFTARPAPARTPGRKLMPARSTAPTCRRVTRAAPVRRAAASWTAAFWTLSRLTRRPTTA